MIRVDKIEYSKMSEKKCYLIAAECGSDKAPKMVKESYDKTVPKTDFIFVDKVPVGYKKIYTAIMEAGKDSQNQPIITVGGDASISMATIVAHNDRSHRGGKGLIDLSDLRVVWLTNKAAVLADTVAVDFNDILLQSITGSCSVSMAPNKMWLKPDQMVLVGLKNPSDEEESFLSDNDFQAYTLEKITQIGIQPVIDSIMDRWDGKPIHLVVDMRVFDKRTAPDVDPDNDSGLTYDQMTNIMKTLGDSVVGVDVVGFTPDDPDKQNNRRTAEMMRTIVSTMGRIKKQRINLMTEDSPFLIYRPVDQLDHDDIGWFILRGVPTELKEKFLKSIPTDRMVSQELELDDGPKDYYLSRTTIREQETGSYYTSTSILDQALFPQEKSLMYFELVTSYAEDSAYNPVDDTDDDEPPIGPKMESAQ